MSAQLIKAKEDLDNFLLELLNSAPASDKTRCRLTTLMGPTYLYEANVKHINLLPELKITVY